MAKMALLALGESFLMRVDHAYYSCRLILESMKDKEGIWKRVGVAVILIWEAL
jgi:hypothetical protein